MIEDQIQADCVKWFRNHFTPYRRQLFSVPNGGKRDKRTATTMKFTGTVPGIPDLIFVNNQNTVFFELKTKTGTLSPEQKIVHATFKKNGFRVHVVRSLVQFQSLILTEFLRTSDFDDQFVSIWEKYFVNLK